MQACTQSDLLEVTARTMGSPRRDPGNRVHVDSFFTSLVDLYCDRPSTAQMFSG